MCQHKQVIFCCLKIYNRPQAGLCLKHYRLTVGQSSVSLSSLIKRCHLGTTNQEHS